MDRDEAKKIAAFEQMGAHLSNYAGIIYEYFKHLNMAGFHRDEALQLVIEIQNILFEQAFKSPPSNEIDEDF
jgi:hypothetical protein